MTEARHGLAWLEKMWDPATRTLHLQVGIGSGNQQGTFVGDHDSWRLPQDDDRDTSVDDRYVSHRPVFDAAKSSPRRIVYADKRAEVRMSLPEYRAAQAAVSRLVADPLTQGALVSLYASLVERAAREAVSLG